MPLSEHAAHVARLSALDLYSSIHAQKGFKAVETHNFQGIRLNVYRGMSDPASDDKVGGVRQALAKLIPLGLDLPDTFDIYTSDKKDFVNVAFQRSMDGERKASIGLGGKLTNPMELPIGIATMKAGTQSTLNFCAAVCVHEIGHVLHEIADAEFFWSAAANEATPGHLGGQVSMYAGNNIKEFVAEVFTALVYGDQFNQQVMTAYAGYHGPTGALFPPA